MATLAEFRAKFPEFAASSDALVNGVLEEATIFTTAATWPNAYINMGQLYLAAHFLAVNKASSSAGGREVISETIGRLSRTFAHSNLASIEELKTTMYGARYMSYRNLKSPKLKTISVS